MAERAEKLRRDLAPNGKTEGDRWTEFDTAVDSAVRGRLSALYDGIAAYREHPYRRGLTEPPAIWQAGTTQLLDFGLAVPGGDKGRPVLFVPSLINRSYVLDLTAEQSLLRWMATHGVRPLLLDWDAPGEVERAFNLSDYIDQRLDHALRIAASVAGEAIPVVGYCMGGLLALAAAVHRPDAVSRLALLATPWDFHCDARAHVQAQMVSAALVAWSPLIAALGELPVDLIQALFALIDPLHVPRKFVRLAALDPASRQAMAFVALEDWLNDGVALAGPVAHECLGGWYGENRPATGRWTVMDKVIEPGGFEGPTLSLIPRTDRIVPPEGARSLAAGLPDGETIMVDQGHIGMVASARARKAVWPTLGGWLAR